MRQIKRTSLSAVALFPVVAGGEPLSIGGEIFIPVNRAGAVEHDGSLFFNELGLIVPSEKWAEVGSELLVSASHLEASGTTSVPKLMIVPDLPEVQVGWSFGGFMLGSTTLGAMGVVGWDYIAWNYFADVSPTEDKIFAETDWYNADPSVPVAQVSFEVSAPSILGRYSPFVPTPEYKLVGPEAGIFDVSSQGYVMIDPNGSDIDRDFPLTDRIGDVRSFEVEATLGGSTANTQLEIQIFETGAESSMNIIKNSFLFFSFSEEFGSGGRKVIGSDQVDIWTNAGSSAEFGYSPSVESVGTLNSQKVFAELGVQVEVYLGGGDDKAFLVDRPYEFNLSLGDGDDELHLWEKSPYYNYLLADVSTGSGRDSIYIYEEMPYGSWVTIQDFSELDQIYLENDLLYYNLNYYSLGTELIFYRDGNFNPDYTVFFEGVEVTSADISRFSYDTENVW